jgi:C-terminal processing protease CtpA/Prc
MYRSLVFSFFLVFVAMCAEANGATKTAKEASDYHTAPEMSEQITENLYLLGKVWGYLKYHHPRVTAGCFDWDEELLGVAEDVAVAVSKHEASIVLGRWVRDLDDPQRECSLEEPALVHFSLDKGWLQDDGLLGSALIEAIAAIRPETGYGSTQHYVSLAEGVGNPQFLSENPYDDNRPLDWRYRLVALFRFWNIIEYWSPYRDLMSADWDAVLTDSIPRFVSADEENQYILELMALVARTQDGHANLWGEIDKRPPAGTLNVPVHIRSIEGRPVVWRASQDEYSVSVADSTTASLAFGDVILTVNGTPVTELINSWSPYYGASNESALRRDVYRYLLRGSEDTVTVRVDRDGQELVLNLRRVPVDRNARRFHDRDGETLQLLSDDIAYLKLSSLSRRNISNYLDRIGDRRGLIIDIRNYPSDFVVFALGQHLVDEPTPFARFTHGDLKSPGTFRWTAPTELTPIEPFFEGRVAILIDESSQSQAEYTAMAFCVAPGAVVIGSQTAGADGNISGIPLPGGHRTAISGIGVFYPDKSPTQQIGIVPDIVAVPTIAGVRAGRDEVLERAVMELMQGEISQEAVSEMTRVPHAPKHGHSAATPGEATH